MVSSQFSLVVHLYVRIFEVQLRFINHSLWYLWSGFIHFEIINAYYSIIYCHIYTIPFDWLFFSILKFFIRILLFQISDSISAKFVSISNSFYKNDPYALQEDICKPVGLLTSCLLPSPYDTQCFCISGFLSSDIQPSSLLAWLKAFPQSHLMSKTSYNNTTIMALLQMPFLLSR